MVRLVLTADVRFEGWTTEDWQRLLSLVTPRSVGPLEPLDGAPRASGGLLIVHDGARVRKLLHTEKGRLPPTDPWPTPLVKLAESYRARWAVAGHFGALDEVMERFGARARQTDDLLTQTLSLLAIVREMTDEGSLERWPRSLSGVPTPHEAVVERAFDSVCGDGRAVVLGMFKGGELWTALVARRRGQAFDVIAGPDALRPAMGVLSGDWRRDIRYLVDAVEERYAPIALGCFAEVETWKRLTRDPRPGAWSRAFAVRDVVLSPIPTAVGLALGFDGARYAYATLKLLTRRLEILRFFDPALDAARKRLGVGAGAGAEGAPRVGGSDPLRALRALLKR